MAECYKNGTHVVAANSLAGVSGYQTLHQILKNLDLVSFPPAVLANLLDHSLVVVHIPFPNSIAAAQNELIFSAPLKLFYVRFARYHLLVVGQLFRLFVCKVSKGTGQVKSSIDPAHCYVSSCLLYPLLLLG